jgi:thiamine kinase-like enzyme
VSPARSAQVILECLPDWRGASIEALPGGLTNRTWRVTRGDRRGVLKVDERPRQAPFNSRIEEARIQSMAAERGLAGPVCHVEEGALLTAWIDGDVWEPAHLADGDNIERLAAALRQLHALPLSGRSFDSTIAARRYVASIDQHDPAIVSHCTRIIASMRRPGNLCFCHNDLVAANIVDAGALMFLDWEYACDNDPFFDLATIVEHHELDDSLAVRLLDAYFDGDGSRWRHQLREQQLLYQALYWLWLAARPDTDGADLQAVAERLGR